MAAENIVGRDDPISVSQRRPFLIRIADQIVPSAITALVMGVVAFKVLEVKVEGIIVRDVEQQASLVKHTVEITQVQERQTALAERFNTAVNRTDITLDRMDARILRIESRQDSQRERPR